MPLSMIADAPISAGEFLKLCKLCGKCISSTVRNNLCESCNGRLRNAAEPDKAFRPQCRSCRASLVFITATSRDEPSLHVCPKCGESVTLGVLRPNEHGYHDYLEFGILTCGKCDKHICVGDGCDIVAPFDICHNGCQCKEDNN